VNKSTFTSRIKVNTPGPEDECRSLNARRLNEEFRSGPGALRQRNSQSLSPASQAGRDEPSIRTSTPRSPRVQTKVKTMNRSHSSQAFAATIGLDWADKKHDLWIQVAAGGKPEHLVIDQTPEALHGWVAKMGQRFPNQRIAIAVETSRGAIISALQAYDFIVIFPINPQMLCCYRRALEPDTELTRKLAALVENRRDLVDERTRMVNRVHSLLKTYYPLAELLFEDMTIPLATNFLLKWPDFASVKKAGAVALRKFFYAHHSRGEKAIDDRLQSIDKAQALTNDPALIEPAVLKLQALAGMLKVLHEAIQTIETAVQEATDAHPDAAIFRSFPSAGPAMAPRLLVAFGTDRQRFESAQEAQQFYGIAPVRKQSGQSNVIHMRHRCPKFARQTFHENASHVVRVDGWAKTLYEQQRARKKGHHAAVRSVAFKLMRIYYRCWKDRKCYDAAIYEAALKQHGSPRAKLLKKDGPDSQ
jgi:transposase